MDRLNGIDARLESIVARKGRDLSGLAVVVVRDRKPVYEGYFGRRIVGDGTRPDLPVDAATKWRAASMSKPVTGLGAMLLAERGLLDLEADVSRYLGFELRNPAYPDRPITAAMLMSHTSSLRDAEYYFPPLSHSMWELFLPEGRHRDGGAHFAAPEDGRDLSPGVHYEYCNLNYGVLATAMERVSGRRFDLYMRDEILAPLGVDASYNVNLLTDAGFGAVSPEYQRISSATGKRDPDGPWVAQVDDYRGVRPEVPVRLPEDAPSRAPRLEEYVVGTNGALFSPQGGLRTSARDLARIIDVFAGKGEVDTEPFGGSGKVRLLAPESVRAMCTPRWRLAPGGRNGTMESGMTRETGLALMHVTDSMDAAGGDRLCPGGGLRTWGHHGDAYGYLGSLQFDPERGCGYVYCIGGTAAAPEGNRGRYSSYPVWEEEIHDAVIDAFFPEVGAPA